MLIPLFVFLNIVLSFSLILTWYQSRSSINHLFSPSFLFFLSSFFFFFSSFLLFWFASSLSPAVKRACTVCASPPVKLRYEIEVVIVVGRGRVWWCCHSLLRCSCRGCDSRCWWNRVESVKRGLCCGVLRCCSWWCCSRFVCVASSEVSPVVAEVSPGVSAAWWCRLVEWNPSSRIKTTLTGRCWFG